MFCCGDHVVAGALQGRQGVARAAGEDHQGHLRSAAMHFIIVFDAIYYYDVVYVVVFYSYLYIMYNDYLFTAPRGKTIRGTFPCLFLVMLFSLCYFCLRIFHLVSVLVCRIFLLLILPNMSFLGYFRFWR